MIFAWVGLVVALVTALMALPGKSVIGTVAWPGEAPLNLHDNRARDPHLRHLARILASDSPTEAHRTVTDLVDGLLASSAITLFEGVASARERLGSPVASFVADTPPKDHEQFLYRLAEALDQIERL